MVEIHIGCQKAYQIDALTKEGEPETGLEQAMERLAEQFGTDVECELVGYRRGVLTVRGTFPCPVVEVSTENGSRVTGQCLVRSMCRHGYISGEHCPAIENGIR